VRRASFVALRRPAWQRFEALLAYSDEASARMTGDEVASLSQLFRGLCHDLATVRSRGWGRDLERYLNDLVVRGHARFYRSPGLPATEALHFLMSGFPRLLRAHARYFWLAAALFVVPAIVSGLVIARDSSLVVYVLPGTTLESLERMHSGSREGPGAPIGMAGFYVWNNAGLAFRCFATGIFFGAGTVFYLVYNGIFLGTVAAYLGTRGQGGHLFTFVVAHASLELTAIVVAGAAGLLIGHALVCPAPFTWKESLRRRGRAGAQLALGAGAMLVLAAIVEAGWSPLPLPAVLKYASGALLWALVVVYLGFAGRGAGAPSP
jgi:uncharacterized membrane protein SpoIIM required for sporulation